MSSLLELIPLLAVAAAGAVLLEALIRRTPVGAILLLSVAVIEVTLDLGLRMTFGPVNVFAEDAVASLLLIAAVARMLRAWRLTPPQLLLISFGALALASLAQGVGDFGLLTAVNEFRKTYWFVAAALYFSTAEPMRRLYDRMGVIFLAATGVLLVLAVFRWGAFAAGLAGGIYGPGNIRVLPARETLYLVQAFLILAAVWRTTGSRLLRTAAPVLLAAVVLLQHRTVWIVLLVGVIVMIWRDPSFGRRAVALAGAGVVVFAALTLTVFEGEEAMVTDELSRSATDAGTMTWRYEGWAALLEENSPEGPGEIATGLPFGTGWERTVSGGTVEVSPHNYYLETYLRLGLAGLAALLALYVAAARRVLRRPDPGGLLSNTTLLVMLATQIVFSFPYSPSPVQGMLLGLMVSAAPLAAGERLAREQRHPELAHG